MPNQDQRIPSEKLLQKLWAFALVIGTAGFGAGLMWLNSAQGPGLDWIWGIAAFGAAALIFNIAYFVLCSLFAPALATLVTDDTEVHGDDVAHVVRYRETGTEAVDFYVRAYATARSVSAVAIVSGIMITVALLFF